jgi:hypothetical protein
MELTLLCRLERVPTFLVPINPPFADYSRHFSCAYEICSQQDNYSQLWYLNYKFSEKKGQRGNNGYIMGI